jgi:hypothetical protein
LSLRLGVVLVILSSLVGIIGCPTKPTTPMPTPPDYKPQPVIDVERIQPFQLEQSFKYDWRRERPDVRSGLLVVFKVDPKLVTPRNELEPVLYAGHHTVQRLNHGHESGFVIGIVPEQIDLSQELVWFGTPALPERIDKETIARERDRAARAGIVPLAPTDVQSRTQDPIVAPDLTTLLREQAAELLLEFSPQEKPLADSWRLPVTGS